MKELTDTELLANLDEIAAKEIAKTLADLRVRLLAKAMRTAKLKGDLAEKEIMQLAENIKTAFDFFRTVGNTAIIALVNKKYDHVSIDIHSKEIMTNMFTAEVLQQFADSLSNPQYIIGKELSLHEAKLFSCGVGLLLEQKQPDKYKILAVRSGKTKTGKQTFIPRIPRSRGIIMQNGQIT